MPYAINTNKCPNECTEFELIKPDEEMLKRYNEFEIICKICENTFSLTTYYTHYKNAKKMLSYKNVSIAEQKKWENL